MPKLFYNYSGKEQPISLLKFSEPSEQKSLECILEAIKVVSMSLPFTTHDHITCHPQVIKMLVISSPVNKQSILFLLQALIGKFKNKQYVIFSVWKIFESVAQLQPKTVSTILTRRIIDFDPDPRKKSSKVSKVEEQYIIANLCEIKRTVLKLIPQLFEIVWERTPMEMKEKLLIFKLFRMQCKDPELLMDISRTADQMKQKYSTERESKRPARVDVVRSQKRKATTRKLLPPPSKFSVDKLLMEEYIYSQSEDLLSVLKTEANVEALLSFVIHPSVHPLEEKVWGKTTAGNEKALQQMRKEKVLETFQDYKYFRRIVATCPQLFNIFFNYLDTHNVNDLNLQGVQNLLLTFLRQQPAIVSLQLMKSSLLQSFYPFCQDSLVYEFILRAVGMINFKYPTSIQLKSLYYTYLRAVDFFPIMVNNLCRVKHDKLTALKPKDILDLETMLKKYYSEKKKLSQSQKALSSSRNPRNSALFDYRQNKTKFFETDRISFFPTPQMSTKKIIEAQPIKAPFAVKEYRGYYSTAPVLNFFCVQQEKINLDNQDWHHLNCKLYYDILRSATLLKNTSLAAPQEILTTIVPDKSCLEEIFILLKKYTYLYKINSKSNSAIVAVKILNLIFQNESYKGYKNVTRLCKQYIHLIYPIICMLFHTEKKPTKLQSLTVMKTLGQNILQMVQLFLHFLHRIDPEEKQSILDEIQEDIWYILMLWMFDCMINNVYQSLVYDIFVELFTYARQSLLIKILFRYNMVSCLHNAHQDIVKNKVLLIGWHIHSFYMHIRRMYFLIRVTYEKRTQLTILKTNLHKLLAWNLLSNKMCSRTTRQDAGSLDDLSRSVYSNCSLISQ